MLPVLFLLTACSDDDGPEVPAEATVLSYDGENVTAPTLPEGIYEFAARFPSSLTGRLEGQSITQVSFYLYDAPSQLYILISPDLTASVPGAPINSQMVNNLTANSWNTVTLNTPVLLDGSNIWVGIEVLHDALQQTIGCDAGPAFSNGNWLYDEATMNWETFSDRTGGNESVNWNIKAIVE